MNVLTLNAGSSSIKSALFSGMELKEIWRAEEEIASADEVSAAVERLLPQIWSGGKAALSDPEAIGCVGHRIVHGGESLTASVEITAEVERKIEQLIEIAPLHNPVNLAAYRAAKKILSARLKHVAVFDTAFHSTMPEPARIYGGPIAWSDSGLRRYGFHGISVQYCVRRCSEILKKAPESLSMIVCHLGNGCSLTAVERGKSVDTTMGMTPLEGPLMGTRSGTVDPGLLLHLLRTGTSPSDLAETLNHKSGLLGLSGRSHDLRVLMSELSNPKVALAIDVFVHQLRRSLGSLLPSLTKLDAVVFTAGIGEHQADVRGRMCSGFPALMLDEQENSAGTEDRLISAEDSPSAVLVIRTNEELEMARECAKIVSIENASISPRDH